MRLKGVVADAIQAAAPDSTRFDVELAKLSRWRIGGTAAALVEPRNYREAANVIAAVKQLSVPAIVVGETSNLLFDSRGFEGVVIRIGEAVSEVRIDGTRIWAQAGVAVPRLARIAASVGLTGIEHTVGIPGTLGGLVFMNGGSQRRGIGENVERVACVDALGEPLDLDHCQCGFAYRQSRLSGLGLIVLEVILQLDYGDRDSINQAIESILNERAAKFPSDYPNCGSTFLSNPTMYATVGPPGRAIEDAGLKGYRVGGVEVSTKHANFLLNVDEATSDDVLELISLIRRVVYARTGYLMDCEVRYVSPTGVIRPAHEAAVEKWGDGVRAGVAEA